ncbi:MAG: hypothetical protein V3S50_04415, partial [Acidobacteriota bacterium]
GRIDKVIGMKQIWGQTPGVFDVLRERDSIPVVITCGQNQVNQKNTQEKENGEPRLGKKAGYPG